MRNINPPTLVTLMRMALVVPVVYLLLEGYGLGALAVFLFASLLDWVDGQLARRLQQQTNLGAMLDHLADKLLICGAMITLVYVHPHPVSLIATLVVVGRDLVMGGLREYWLKQGLQERAMVNLFGKWKTTLQMAAICLLLLAHWQAPHDMLQLAHLAYGLVTLVTLLSLVNYLKPMPGAQ